MGKNILMLTGSPRRSGNSAALADAFIEGARKNGHTVNRLDAAFLNVGSCTACMGCQKDGTPCAFDDDFNIKLAPLLKEADMLVISSPVYFYSFPAKLKAAIDKMYCFRPSAYPQGLKIKESAIILCAHDEEPMVFAGILKSYELILDYFGWKNAGVLPVTKVSKKGDVYLTDWVSKAQLFGESV